ncbi:MAG: GPW/gp25 family protein [Anaerolineae bacterium]|nr:GPW/gp25 family protein [Anaerolineae bacterium]
MLEEITGRGWVFPPKIGPHGGIALTHEQDEIEQAIHIILTTAPGERVMRPTFGCRLDSLVFEPNNSHTAAQARRYVEQALGMWEPRINLTRVNVYPDPQERHCLLVEIDYRVKQTHDERSLVYPFYLIPEE